MKPQKIFNAFCFLYLTSCFSWLSDFSLSRNYLFFGNCKKAYQYFSYTKQSAKKHRRFALKAAEVCKKKEPFFTYSFYESALNNERDPELQIRLKKLLAEISFFNLKNYEKALHHYQDLFKVEESLKKKLQNQYQIIWSYIHLEKPSQALLEVERLLKQELSQKRRKTLSLLKGSLLLALEDNTGAQEFFQEQIQKHPSREAFYQEYLALLFEKQGKLLSAQEALEKIEKPSPFLKQKLKSLLKKIENQPRGRLK